MQVFSNRLKKAVDEVISSSQNVFIVGERNSFFFFFFDCLGEKRHLITGVGIFFASCDLTNWVWIEVAIRLCI